MQSCNTSDKSNSTLNTGSDSISTIESDQKKTPEIVSEGKQKKEEESKPASSILGRWALVGSDNASFVIEPKEIFYPEHSVSYKYSLKNDSLKIFLDGYTSTSFVKMKGSDTLILNEFEEQIYYRFKN